jgi:hypothetical protein
MNFCVQSHRVANHVRTKAIRDYADLLKKSSVYDPDEPGPDLEGIAAISKYEQLPEDTDFYRGADPTANRHLGCALLCWRPLLLDKCCDLLRVRPIETRAERCAGIIMCYTAASLLHALQAVHMLWTSVKQAPKHEYVFITAGCINECVCKSLYLPLDIAIYHLHR